MLPLSLLLLLLLLLCPAPAQAVFTSRIFASLQHLLHSPSSLSSVRWLDFGSQHFHKVLGAASHPDYQREGFRTHTNAAKFFFQHLGVLRHVSVDMNGRNGALQLDCREDLTDHLPPRSFDVVTNLKFSHHIGQGTYSEEDVMLDQYRFWKNMHDLGTDDALYVHEVVEGSGEMVEVGVAYHSLAFMRQLALLCGYIIEEDHSFSSTTTLEHFSFPFSNGNLQLESEGLLTHTVFWRKGRGSSGSNGTDFVSWEEFRSLPGISVVTSRTSFHSMFSHAHHSPTTRAFINTAAPDTSVAKMTVHVCRTYFPSVEEETCLDFVERHFMFKMLPWTVDLFEHDPAYEYGYMDHNLMHFEENKAAILNASSASL